MRDKVKNEEYFINCINYEKDRINKFSRALEEIGEQNVKGLNKALTYLANFNKNLFKLSYSIGYSIEDTYYYYKEWIKYYSEICTESDSLYDVIDMFSIGVFYKDRKDDFEKYLILIINKINLEEGMLNLCLCYLESDLKKISESKLPYINILLKSDCKADLLISISREWYKFHQDAYWYDMHKSKNDTYCGYWSFDLGAIVKIFQLDDEELRQQQTYPYDLVHFND